ncbi:MAG TPA: hypothetical protein VK824_08155 [Planctomycetota bacterium]|nr:hypothetical protein [Planctomycetota bacterium]
MARVLGIVLLVAYPVLVHFGVTHGSPRLVALVLLGVLLPVVLLRWRRPDAAAMRGLALIPLVTVAALGLGAVLDAGGFVLAVPVAVNALLLLAFGATLRRGAVPMIERFARLQEPGLPAPKCRWCRQWTVAWCAFFALNGAIALVLALAAPLAWWTVYNGLLAYVLMGLLFATEWIGRRLRFGLPGDALGPP